MTVERFTALLDELPETRDLTLQGLGEPLLAPGLLDMVRIAKRRGITVGFNTNATLLTRARAGALVDAGLDWICISLDGATPETYEGIRDGARFERVAANIRGLIAVKRERGASHPAVKLVMVAMRRNLGELERVVLLAAEWGVPTVLVQNLSHSFDDTGDGYAAIRSFTRGEALWADQHVDRAAMDEAFARARAVAAERGVTLNLPKLDARAPGRRPGSPGCERPWQDAYVGHDGTLQPCCMVMGSDRSSLGNAFEGGFDAVWSGPAMRAFRGALLTDDPPDVCRGCALYHGVF
jgi:radical SAM protein with 4Fe4S-binding SPASM domain